MVKGLDSFIAQFRDFTDCYTVIGGAACDILMSEAGLEFRATKDVDMILILEDPGRFTGFAERFWEYIRQGGYTCGWKNSDSVDSTDLPSPRGQNIRCKSNCFLVCRAIIWKFQTE